jgi:hypothetical protein
VLRIGTRVIGPCLVLFIVSVCINMLFLGCMRVPFFSRARWFAFCARRPLMSLLMWYLASMYAAAALTPAIAPATGAIVLR